MQIVKYQFQQHGDNRGNLIALEEYKDIPFEIKRVYYMYDTAKGVRRGFHSHKNLEQILVCIHGSCKVLLDNGIEKKTIYLEKPYEGLYVPNNTWREMYDFSDDAVLLVLASEYYIEEDYIRDYDEFLKFTQIEKNTKGGSMELICVNKNDYDKIIQKSHYIYNESWFHELNKEKVDYIQYMLFKSKKYKLGIIAGVIDNIMKFPYSSPYAIFEKISTEIKIEDIEEALDLLENYCKKSGVMKIQFRLPPTFYDETFLSKMQNCFIRKGYNTVSYDLNYQYFLRDQESFLVNLKRNAKKNLKIALTNNYKLVSCHTLEMKKTAYNIIATNRKNKGFPLRMNWKHMQDTIEKLNHDIFILQLEENLVAAAVVFKVTDDIYQVIYWGDIEGYTEEKPMNYLSYQLYKYYLSKGVKVLDIGPSTEDGVPNYGLCSFKESIGCEVSSKITYVKEIS